YINSKTIFNNARLFIQLNYKMMIILGAKI
ncbi:MAG: hypothetical protein ACI81A_002716, partial [Paraglaciecola sp.]